MFSPVYSPFFLLQNLTISSFFILVMFSMSLLKAGCCAGAGESRRDSARSPLSVAHFHVLLVLVYNICYKICVYLWHCVEFISGERVSSRGGLCFVCLHRCATRNFQ